ncbi:phage antirepressor KilAC domain-containing protein [Mycobacteroides abscessus]|uniref:phage antirepressor KilAC domain-containing protein n=2 Tax=Mycobacteroides abscessus TaxID=36809 RepID=UPI0012E91798|nr:phage antirepressor KilAC domain-containing protein [Mycobacteroides abscessus]
MSMELGRYAVAESDSASSPFDSSRETCPRGGEDRYSARKLMDLMGYDNWQNFERSIERAKQAAHNEGFNVRTLFTAVSKKAGPEGGRPRLDYLVTRYAAYLIAMNGDPRKPEVSAAQHYFATKTRQAEVALAAPMTDDEIIHRALEVSARRVAAITERAEAAEAKVIELAPKAEFYDHLMDADGCFSMNATAKVLGWGRNIMMAELRKLGILQRSNNLPYQRYAHHFKVVPGTYEHPSGQTVPYATAFVLPSGIPFLRRKLAEVRP